MSLVLHGHPLSSFTWKALIALYEKDLPFELRVVNFQDPASTEALFAAWPLGKMPVLEDDGRVIPESSILIEHLDRRAPAAPLIPTDPDAALRVRLLDRLFDDYVMDPMQRIVGDRLRPAEAKDPFGVAQYREQLGKALTVLQDQVEGPYAAGSSFTLADCAAAPSLHYANKVQPFEQSHPALFGYLQRLEARPSFARVLRENQPYAHMFPEA